MMPARAGCALLFAFGAFFVFAQNLTVAYVGGDVKKLAGSTWRGISIGDKLSAENTLQLGDGAYVELNWTQAKIALSQKGTYKLHDILAYSRSLGSVGAGKALLGKLSRILAGTGNRQSNVAGVRGANAGNADASEWMTSDTQASLDAGKEYIDSGQLSLAIEQLLLALDSATDKESPQVRFYLAYAYALKGDSRNALKYSTDLRPNQSDEWAPDFVILRAKLLMDGSAFAQEVEWLTHEGNDLSGDAQRADIYFFLLALGYGGMEDVSNEKQYLSKVISVSGESELGKAAARLERIL
jgi:hypothetical protein